MHGTLFVRGDTNMFSELLDTGHRAISLPDLTPDSDAWRERVHESCAPVVVSPDARKNHSECKPIKTVWIVYPAAWHQPTGVDAPDITEYTCERYMTTQQLARTKCFVKYA